MLKIIKPSEIESVIGTEVGLSDWIKIDQEQINKFAEATLDNQFIHVDPEQAEPIFGSTIAHGFLSLSLCAGIPFSQGMGLVIDGMKMGLNYGLDKVRFLSPVPRFLGPKLEEYGPFDEEDVANLPSIIVDILVEKGRAEGIIVKK